MRSYDLDLINIYKRYDSSRIICPDSINIMENNAFLAFMKVPIEDTIDIPVFALQGIINLLRDGMDVDEISINLFSSLLVREKKKSFTKDMKSVFINRHYSARLCKVKIKDSIYYVGKGVILTEQFKPLIVCTLRINKQDLVKTFNRLYTLPDIASVTAVVKIDTSNIVERGPVHNFINKTVKEFLFDMKLPAITLLPLYQNYSINISKVIVETSNLTDTIVFPCSDYNPEELNRTLRESPNIIS